MKHLMSPLGLALLGAAITTIIVLLIPRKLASRHRRIGAMAANSALQQLHDIISKISTPEVWERESYNLILLIETAISAYDLSLHTLSKNDDCQDEFAIILVAILSKSPRFSNVWRAALEALNKLK